MALCFQRLLVCLVHQCSQLGYAFHVSHHVWSIFNDPIRLIAALGMILWSTFVKCAELYRSEHPDDANVAQQEEFVALGVCDTVALTPHCKVEARTSNVTSIKVAE